MGNRKMELGPSLRGPTPSCGRGSGERHLGKCVLGGVLVVGASSGVVRLVDLGRPCGLMSSKLGGPQ